jgi:ribosomal protein L11 methyltransferase
LTVRAFVVSVAASDGVAVDLVSDALWRLGVRGIEERTSSSDVGITDLWTSVGDGDDAVERAVVHLTAALAPISWTWRTVVVDDAVAETWRDHARPTTVDEVVTVVPAWVQPPATYGGVTVLVEPLGAFGLGDHPTTLLSMRAARPLIDGRCDVLDVGCGTGVIAVMAARLGARSVRAIDISSAAVEATQHNARLNEVEDRVRVGADPLAIVEGEYDLVVANILAPVLVELAADLRRTTRAGGRLVVSGVLDGAYDHVLDALAPLVVERTAELDGWAAVTLRHP